MAVEIGQCPPPPPPPPLSLPPALAAWRTFPRARPLARDGERCTNTPTYRSPRTQREVLGGCAETNTTSLPPTTSPPPPTRAAATRSSPAPCQLSSTATSKTATSPPLSITATRCVAGARAVGVEIPTLLTFRVHSCIRFQFRPVVSFPFRLIQVPIPESGVLEAVLTLRPRTPPTHGIGHGKEVASTFPCSRTRGPLPNEGLITPATRSPGIAVTIATYTTPLTVVMD